MSIAYIVLAHSSLDQLGRLLSAIYNDSDQYLIHLDLKAPLRVHHGIRHLANKFQNIHIIRSRNCSWGGLSLADATISGMSEASRLSSEWSHIVLLSESHLPLQHNSSLRQSLQHGESTIQLRPFTSLGRISQMDIVNRCQYVFKELPGVGPFPTTRVAHKVIETRLNRLSHGSQWFILSKDAVMAVLANYQSDEFSWLSSVFIPDELFLHTVLSCVKEKYSLNIRNEIPVCLSNKRQGIPKKHMTFDADEYFAAKDRGFFFIRKSPLSLPESVMQFIDSISDHRICRELSPFIGASSGSNYSLPCMRSIVIDSNKEHIRELLAAFKFAKLLDYKVKATRNSPSIDFQLMPAGAQNGLSLRVLSEDGVTVKLIIVQRSGTARAVHPQYSGRFRRAVVKTRVHGISLNHEISPVDSLNYGFTTFLCGDPDSISAFSTMTANYYDLMQEAGSIVDSGWSS